MADKYRVPNWTPAPWRVFATREIIVNADPHHVIARVENYSTPRMMEANAALIAAAPELFDALSAIIEAADLSLARAALAKARGDR